MSLGQGGAVGGHNSSQTGVRGLCRVQTQRLKGGWGQSGTLTREPLFSNEAPRASPKGLTRGDRRAALLPVSPHKEHACHLFVPHGAQPPETPAPRAASSVMQGGQQEEQEVTAP